MYSTTTQIRVRYNETDRMGYLHHGYYAVYLEIARTEMLRSMGTTYRIMEDSGIILPVFELHINYKAPAFYDELLTVKTVMKEMPVVRLNLTYEVVNEKGDLICTGSSTNVFVDAKSRRPIKAPVEILERFSEFFRPT